MSLNRHELQRYNQAVLAVHATAVAAQFSANLLRALRLVASGDIAVVDWNRIEGVVRHTAYDPPGAICAEINAAVHRHLHQNPLYLRRQDGPRSISDSLTRREWHRTALYGEAYGRLGQEDGLGLDMALGRGMLTLNITRGRRGFGGGERLALGLLEPHIRSCWQRLRAQERLQAAVSADGAAQRLDTLSKREREVLGWVGNGLRNRQIAELLGIRPATVKRHLENLYARLGLDGRGEARRLLAAVEQQVLPRD